jgi:hypothetical protein
MTQPISQTIRAQPCPRHRAPSYPPPPPLLSPVHAAHTASHASHLAEWFSSKTVCPVAECMCHCLRMDGFAASLRGIPHHLLRSGAIAKWGVPFTGGALVTGVTSTSLTPEGGGVAPVPVGGISVT